MTVAQTSQERSPPPPAASMFWRVLRVLVIVYCGVLGAVILFVLLESGVGDFFEVRRLQAVDDALELLEWSINFGNVSLAVFVVSLLGWAVAWHRGEGRPARRLEWCYGIVAMILFAITAGGFLSVAVFWQLQGRPGFAMDVLIAGIIVIPMINAPAMLMASYVLWGVIRRSMGRGI